MKNPSIEELNAMNKGTLGESLGMEFVSMENGLVIGKMPVDQRTCQPYGRLHGGATAALAETLGSVGSHFIVAEKEKAAVGVEINTNHLRGVKSGFVFGKAKLIHEGGKIHVWSIDVEDEQERLVAVARLTVMIIPRANG
ncbi:MAG: hotdog fold thioesterase [Bacteroidota bacterium]